MRLYHVLMFLVPCLTLLSCKKDNDPAKIPVKENFVQLIAGQNDTLIIGGAVKSYTATTDHPDIAGAIVTNNKIVIATHKPGMTFVRVSDGTLTASIKLWSTALDGRWVVITGDANYAVKVTVEGTDAVFAATLKQQLESEMALPANTLLGVSYAYGPPGAFRAEYGDHTRRDGAYSYDKLTVAMEYNGVTETYRVIPVSKTIIGLERSLTGEYQALHADKGLQQVTVTRYLRYRPNPG